jgi:hypothetical protein
VFGRVGTGLRLVGPCYPRAAAAESSAAGWRSAHG